MRTAAPLPQLRRDARQGTPMGGEKSSRSPVPLSNRYAATAWRKHGGRAGLRRLIFPCRQGRAALALQTISQTLIARQQRRRDLMSALVDRRRLREEAFQNVIADGVVLLVERGMRDARHHGELLVGVGQPLEELYEVGKARDAVVFAAH